MLDAESPVQPLPTVPPGPADAAALEFARRVAGEPDTGPVALPGSVRFAALADRKAGK